MNFAMTAVLLVVAGVVLIPVAINSNAQSNIRSITHEFDDYGFCCYTWSQNLTIIGNINSVNASMNQDLASDILGKNNFTLLNYTSSPQGTHITAVQNGTD